MTKRKPTKKKTTKKRTSRKKPAREAPMLTVQNGPDEAAIREAGIALMAILNSGQDQATIQAAVAVLGRAFKMKNGPMSASITGCTFEA